ncbi:MAG: hypothetical protein A2Y33_00290 [Spirochaetes bacterium GWF1_51_8]|nr:MAG: hypothetical protein A2Y33_00290 [Spirochaetes bacterium GWF1_51_8]
MDKSLYRSRTNRKIGGVCAGIAEYTNMPVGVVRFLFILLVLMSGGLAFFLYLFMMIFVPEEPAGFGRGAEEPNLQPVNMTFTASKSAPNKTEFTTPEPPRASEPPKPETQTEFEKTYQEFVKGSGTSTSEAKPVKAAMQSIGLVLSLFVALCLIALGVYLIMPEQLIVFRKAGSVVIGLLLFVFSAQMMVTTISKKVYSFFIFSLGAVFLTIAFFMVVTGFDILSYNVFGAYFRLLLPVGLVALGVKVVAQTLAKRGEYRPAGILVVSIMFLFFGFYAADQVKAMEPGLKSIELPSELKKVFATSNISSEFSSADMPEDITMAVYKIVNNTGNTKIGVTGGDITYKFDGSKPNISEVIDRGYLNWSYEHTTGDSEVNLSGKYPADIDLKVSTGNIKADVSAMKIKNASLLVSSGDMRIKFGGTVSSVSMTVYAGEGVIEIPETASVHMTFKDGAGSIAVPGEFEKVSDTEWSYNGGGMKIEIDAEVGSGNIKIRLY